MRLSFPILFTLIVVGWPGALTAADSSPADTAKLQAYVTSYCISCHGAEKSEGDLRLDQLTSKGWADYALFDEIVSRVADGEMPPEDAKKPLPEAEKLAMLTQLKARLTTLADQQLAGKYKKLTAVEYNNTIADVFGTPIAKPQNLPFDSDKDLKKIGEHQVVTSYAVKKYYSVARDYLDRHIVVDVPPVKEITYTQPDNPKQWIHTSRFNRTPLGPLVGSGNSPAFMLRSPVDSYTAEGEYELTFEYRTFYIPPSKKGFNPENEYEPGKVSRPPIMYVTGGMRVLNPLTPSPEDKPHYECRYDQPIRVLLDKNTKFITLRTRNGFGPQLEDDPRYLAVEKLDLPEKEKSARRKAIYDELKIESKKNPKPKVHILITGVKIRGPLNKQSSPVQTRIFGDVKRDAPFDACRPILTRFASELFRRPVNEAALQPYLNIAQQEYEENLNAYGAVKLALNAMLCSPHFVFKFEGDQRQLDDYMIAARLSYFLWNSTPDEELLTLAAAGKLQDPVVRREQALRLLNNREKSHRFTQNFTHQWLGMDRFGQFAPNEAYLESSRYKAIQPYISAEPQQFFNEILYNNLSALNFIDSDFVIWNRNLYSLYGGAGMKINYDREVENNTWQKMTLQENPDRIRGGLPSMGAIMSLTTDGENPQPILRGVWLARRMLGTEIEAPATVPAIEINLENVSKPREILAKHKSDKSCYACHVKFDYLGLAMENYDVLGRFKTDYVHPVIDEKGRPQLVTKDPIDSLSVTPDGQAMPGVAGLKAHLMANKETVMRNLAETLFSYALGREVRYKDRDRLDALLKGMRENDYQLQDAILALIASDSFAQR